MKRANRQEFSDLIAEQPSFVQVRQYGHAYEYYRTDGKLLGILVPQGKCKHTARYVCDVPTNEERA